MEDFLAIFTVIHEQDGAQQTVSKDINFRKDFIFDHDCLTQVNGMSFAINANFK